MIFFKYDEVIWAISFLLYLFRVKNVENADVKGLGDMLAHCGHEVEVFRNYEGSYGVDAGSHWKLIPEEDENWIRDGLLVYPTLKTMTDGWNCLNFISVTEQVKVYEMVRAIMKPTPTKISEK